MGYIARQVEASDRERVNAESVDPGPTADTGGEPETTVDTLTPGETTGTGVEPRVSGIPPSTSESRLCTWIECSHDKRTWAEVQEEEQNEVGEGVQLPLQELAPTPNQSAPEELPESTGGPGREN